MEVAIVGVYAPDGSDEEDSEDKDNQWNHSLPFWQDNCSMSVV